LAIPEHVTYFLPRPDIFFNRLIVRLNALEVWRRVAHLHISHLLFEMSDQDNSTVDVEASSHQNEVNVVPETEVVVSTSPTSADVEDDQKTLRIRKPITYEELSDDNFEPWMDDDKLKAAEDVDTDDLLSDTTVNKKFPGGKGGSNGRSSSNRQRKKKQHFDDTDANSDDAFDAPKRKAAPKRKPAAKKPNVKGKAVEPIINIADLIKASKPVSRLLTFIVVFFPSNNVFNM
jgi:hypothetical protein